jgi:hypothetical protein
MTIHTKLLTTVLVVLALGMLAACGGTAPATLTDVPVYPDAVELKSGESSLADTLGQNNQNDAALRAQLGTGGKTEQKGYSLPKGATWDQVKSFYDDKLKSAGWSTNSLVSGIMDQANQGNDLFHVANWQRGTQNVSIVMLTSPTNADEKQVLVSLSSQ